MQTITPPEPVFFFTEGEGKLFRIMAYLLKDDGNIDVLLDNGRTMKNFNKTKGPDMCFSGKQCPEWLWRQAAKAAEASGTPSDESLLWRSKMFGVTVAEPEIEPPKPADKTLSWMLEDMLSRRTADILAASKIFTVKELLLSARELPNIKAIQENPLVRSEIHGFMAAYGKKVRDK